MMTTMSTIEQPSLTRSQRGVVSLMVVMVMMVIIGLIVLGLAQLSRREQRVALDNQLSTQAFYAAESGVNDVWSFLKTQDTVPMKTSCNNASPYDFLNSTKNVDAANGVSYSCVLVDPYPTVLSMDALGSEPETLTLQSKTGNFSSLTFSWQKPDGVNTPIVGANCPTGTSSVFSTASNWSCPYGVLRLDMVRAPGNSALTRPGLISNTMSAFLIPSNGGVPSVNYQTGAVKKTVKCTDSTCSATITGLNSRRYFVRLQQVYRSSDLRITGQSTAGGAAHFSGSQVDVDVTGKAQDVLRRIKVALDVGGSNPNGAVSGALMVGDNICKKFNVYSGTFQNDQQVAGSDDPFCQAEAVSTTAPIEPTTPPALPPASSPSPSCAGSTDVVLTLDFSSSMQDTFSKSPQRSRLQELQVAAKAYVDAQSKKTGVRTAIVLFWSKSEVIQGFTSNSTQLKTAIDSMNWHPGIWGTNYVAGLDATSQLLNTTGSSKRIMVFISDGQPDGMPGTYPSILNTTSKIKNAGTEVYTIGIYPNSDVYILPKMATDASHYKLAKTNTGFESYFSSIGSSVGCN